MIRDFFELTELPFDGASKLDKKTVVTQVEKARKKVSSDINHFSKDVVKRDDLLAEMEILNSVYNKDAKGNETYDPQKLEELAAIRREDVTNQLNLLIRSEKLRMTGKSSSLLITNERIKSLKKKIGLTEDAIRALYEKNGFDIAAAGKKIDFPKVFSQIQEFITKVKETTDVRYPDLHLLNQITDLYALAAFASDPETVADGASYRSKDNKTLVQILEGYRKKYATSNDPVRYLLKEAAGRATKNVFDSNEHRNLYDIYLKTQTPEVVEIFTVIKLMPEEELRDQTTAMQFVDVLTRHLGDSDTALAVYNHEANLDDNPVERLTAKYTVPCPRCRQMCEFASYAEATRVNKCPNCGTKLFKICPQCKTPVFVDEPRCTNDACNYIFPNAELFNDNMVRAEDALKNGRITDAREYLTRAKAADSGATDRIAVLERKIATEEEKLNKPLNNLRVLMSQNKYEEAKKYLGEIAAKFPTVDLSDQKDEIDRVLNACWQKYNAAQRSNKAERTAACADIVRVCVDFSAAVEYLNNNPPEASGRIETSANDEDETILVTWQPSRERGVTYYLLRKDGKYYSASPRDGKLIYSGSETSFIDKDVVPGTLYCYTVFVARMSSFSQPAPALGKLLLGIKRISSSQTAKSALFSWHLPPNSTGATVWYTVGGKKYPLAENAHESVELTNLQYGSSYELSFVANYGALGKSDISSFAFSPTPIVDEFSITAAPGKDGSYSISWSIKEKGIDLQIIANGKVIGTARSEMRSSAVILPENSFAKVSVRAFSGGNWVDSTNEIVLNTYQPVQIYSASVSEKTTKTPRGLINMAEVNVKLYDPPSNVTGFYCFVRTKQPGSSGAPWASEKEVKGAERVDIETYSEWREIVRTVQAKEEDAYYITVFTVFDVNGKEVISAPARKKLVRPLKADIFWSVSKSFFGPAKLTVEMKPNYPIIDRPALILCASSMGRNLLSPDDASAVRISDIPAETYDEAKKYSVDYYDISIPNNIRRNERLFLFLRDDSKNESFAVRWAEGFDGRL